MKSIVQILDDAFFLPSVTAVQFAVFNNFV